MIILPLWMDTAAACASCGSGGDDPLILYPNEEWKVYSGLTHTFAYQLVDQAGKVVEAAGPDKKTQLTLSAGHKLSLRSFATLSIPYITNHHGGRRQRGFGDPLVSARYTLVMPDITAVFLPQVQLVASYRRGASRSIHTSRDPDQLDVFGSGFSQTRVGVDIWSGLTPVQYGAAHVVGFSSSKTVAGHRIQPGNEARTTLTVGKGWEGLGKVAAGIVRTQVAPLADGGERIADSDQRAHGLFLTADYFYAAQATLRLTLARQGALFQNKNTSRNTSFTLALMRAF